MNNVIDRGILSGRPFGGVAILVRSTLAKHCRLLCKSERFIILSYCDSLFINVYLPCASVKNYVDVYCDMLADISAVLSSCTYQSVVFGGDMNYDFSADGAVSILLSNCMSSLKLAPTYTHLCSSRHESYRHASLQASSLIDHFLVSNSLLDAVHRVEIVDDGCNLSDHMPVVMLLSLQGLVRDNNTNPSKKLISSV